MTYKIRKYSICHLAQHHDTKLFGWKKTVHPCESQQFAPLKYFRRCVDTHVFHLISEK